MLELTFKFKERKMLERTKYTLRLGDKLKSTKTGLTVRFAGWTDRDGGLFKGEVYQRGLHLPLGYISNKFTIETFNMLRRVKK